MHRMVKLCAELRVSAAQLVFMSVLDARVAGHFGGSGLVGRVAACGHGAGSAELM
jgi:hypothetical protein